MDDEELRALVKAYAAKRGQRVAEFFGSGLHGMVCLLEDNTRPGQTALKIHRYPEPYQQERSVYERLRERGVSEIRLWNGQVFQVPQLLHADDTALALEMTVVTPPYVLDFASSDLDARRELPEGGWEQWEARWEEEWGEQWETVQLVLAWLQSIGVFMLDPSPSNVRFE